MRTPRSTNGSVLVNEPQRWVAGIVCFCHRHHVVLGSPGNSWKPRSTARTCWPAFELHEKKEIRYQYGEKNYSEFNFVIFHRFPKPLGLADNRKEGFFWSIGANGPKKRFEDRMSLDEAPGRQPATKHQTGAFLLLGPGALHPTLRGWNYARSGHSLGSCRFRRPSSGVELLTSGARRRKAL